MAWNSVGIVDICLVIGAAAFYSIRVLREYERGVVFQLGRFWKVKGPGLDRDHPGDPADGAKWTCAPWSWTCRRRT